MDASRTLGVFRRFGLRHKAFAAALGGALAVLPAALVSETAAQWVNTAATEYSGTMALEGGYPPEPGQIGVDGSLPDAPDPEDLTAYELPSPGPLGIPSTALEAYRNAARVVGAEFPACHIDWALIASIGRIESNHARGGYVRPNGDTLEPILGPVLNGVGPVAAIPDTDGGRYDGDTTWDRAVGPTQFIPATWARYGADGNGDGVRDPNNIFDATVATGRYLCSGGLDLAKDDQLRAALYRYNNSDTYVETVILWAQAYRDGVATVPDSRVPLAVPQVVATEAPSPVAPPPAAPGAPPPSTGGTGTTPPGSPPPGTQLPSETGPPPGTTTTTPPTTTDTCEPPPTTTPASPTETTSPSPTPPNCETTTPPTTTTTPTTTTGEVAPRTLG
ncbi:hypothetical protein DI005_36230 [Prauserella sp. PE36]|uniref:lytic transglycosylase domain-containing protein n=1 Tax=Prauserella sp. PE36 TaxID=1504709 RepID=UPI000DE53F93|nr:lytic murein transglycosylase [Prauserella sp. PE36]RBM10636.1 hypothetical protein DI005_36230 [Prauserella sp. PE36]